MQYICRAAVIYRSPAQKGWALLYQYFHIISGSSSNCGKLPTWEQKDFTPPQNLIAETQAKLDCFSIPHSFAERITHSANDLYLFIHSFILNFLFFALLPHYSPIITMYSEFCKSSKQLYLSYTCLKLVQYSEMAPHWNKFWHQLLPFYNLTHGCQ